ncbi:hypothetical protein GIW54_30550 [Pseudomonas proteolytica]|uniref:Uncharacterized protein n=1 Tax=Pseudomonas proteolytica TaxID=219574 RepID=A0AAW5ABH3_9PSED|nr:hypothetical protein [Pseudomonas proteolytica]MCF5105046.1 hypothetical protein [Pseudomonas proteolytica]
MHSANNTGSLSGGLCSSPTNPLRQGCSMTTVTVIRPRPEDVEGQPILRIPR